MFAQFIYLQLLDVLTTLAFLLNGVAESNPLVRWAMSAAPNPVTGLVLVKVVAIVMGVYCVASARQKLLRKRAEEVPHVDNTFLHRDRHRTRVWFGRDVRGITRGKCTAVTAWCGRPSFGGRIGRHFFSWQEES